MQAYQYIERTTNAGPGRVTTNASGLQAAVRLPEYCLLPSETTSL